ncbi:MAG: putative transporter permease/ATP-binding protein [Ilumatobacteraceae bacterium]|nr:putative transporter permease/ATP-binding protein [Ilumatobacteraceae bacterium]
MSQVRDAANDRVPDRDTNDEKTPWRLLTGLLAEQKRGLITGVTVGLAWAAAKVSIPSLIQRAIDRGIRGDESLWKWSLIIGGVGVLAGVFTGWRRWLAFRESRTTEARLRQRLFDHIVRLHVGYHDHAQTGQLMSRASSDLQQLQAFVVMIPLVLSNLFQLIAIVVLLVASDPLLALLALAPLPFVNISARRFSGKIHPAVMAVQNRQAALATVVEETVSGVRVVKGFGAEGVQSAKLSEEADRIRVVSLEAARIRSRFLPAIDLLPSIGLILVLAVGGHRVLRGQMTIGQLIEFNASVLLLIWPMRNIGMTLATGQRAAVALQRVQAVLSTDAEVADPPHPVELPAGRAALGALELRDITFGYDTERIVLDGFDVTIPGGTSVAIVGATGSGKSTITRLLLRFYDVQRGAILLDGCDLRALRLADLRRAVGVVFEDTLLFHDTVAGNIAFADPEASDERIIAAARLAGAHDFVSELPDGYNTLLGERGFSLSGGQRQRIAIARAILADPRVLILDDATSAVDPSKEHEIRDAMATVMRDRTTIVIAHRPGTIALADTVLLLDGGRIAAQGTHDQLLASSAAYRDVLASWAAVDDGAVDDEALDDDADVDEIGDREPAVPMGGE